MESRGSRGRLVLLVLLLLNRGRETCNCWRSLVLGNFRWHLDAYQYVHVRDCRAWPACGLVNACSGGVIFQSNSALLELPLQTYSYMYTAVLDLLKYCFLKEP